MSLSQKLYVAVAAMLGAIAALFRFRSGLSPAFVGRQVYRNLRFADSTALQFRMPAGFAGDVSRTHPAAIEPAQIRVATPPTAYGIPVVVDADGAGVRPFGTGEASDTVAAIAYGFTARPFPTQQTSTTDMSATIGAATPPTKGVIDVLRSGYIMATLNPAAAVTGALKGGRVYVWCAATTGSVNTLHTQGGLEVAASSGNTVELDGRFLYNGPADANGVLEVSVNV